MKKIFIVILIILTVAAGCGQRNAQEGESQAPSVQETAEGDNKGQENQQEQKEEPPAEPQLPGALLVMVDNNPQAWPQVGLDKADLVYELLAEGGITRYMALFHQTSAPKIGPVRSARYFFAQLARGLDSPLAHAGGSADSLALIKNIKMKDLDEIYNSGAYFWREKTRKPPHNLYTSTDRLIKGAKDRKLALVSPALQPLGGEWTGEEHQDIILDYSRGKYKYHPSWHFNGRYYERSIDGKPHVMEDGAKISADNIIVMTAVTREFEKQGEPAIEIDVVGKGEARFFIEGKVSEGTWAKASVQEPLKFYDEKGAPVALKAGKTWIQVLPRWSDLKY